MVSNIFKRIKGTPVAGIVVGIGELMGVLVMVGIVSSGVSVNTGGNVGAATKFSVASYVDSAQPLHTARTKAIRNTKMK